MNIQLAKHRFQLLADCGLYWPDQRTVFVADTHFGKEATFRRHGIPVPTGSTTGTLAKLARMLRQTDASKLIILGDMFHARSSLSDEVQRSLTFFMEEFAHVQLTLVRGNHDARVGQLPAAWPIEIVDPIITIEGVALGHHPSPLPVNADVYLCGHLHPAIRVGTGKDSLGKLPCFWHSQGCVVLPAIGEFTGTHVVKLADDDDAWIVADGEVFAYPA